MKILGSSSLRFIEKKLIFGLFISGLILLSGCSGGDSNSSEDTFDNSGDIPVENDAPSAPTASIVLPTNFQFNINNSIDFQANATDSDGTIASYSWNFGDGTTSTDQNSSHSYAQAGTYTATLTVTDDDGTTGTDTVSLTISATTSNSSPGASITAPATSAFETDATINFQGSGTDSDGTIASYSWDFGDGSTSTDQNPSHSYSQAGDYTVILTVTDDDGATGTATLSLSVESDNIANSAPTAVDQNIYSFSEIAKSITLTGTVDDNDDLTYEIKTYPANGTLSATAPNLYYTSDAGFTGSDSFTFVVNDGQEYSSVATVTIEVQENDGSEPDAQVRTVGVFFIDYDDIWGDVTPDPEQFCDVMYTNEKSSKALIETSTYGKIVLDPDFNGDGDPDYYILEPIGGSPSDDTSDQITLMRQEGIIPIDDYDHKIFVYPRVFWNYYLSVSIWGIAAGSDRVWIQFYGSYPNVLGGTIAHEIGHNLGLQHVTEGSVKYGDDYGFMGENRMAPVGFIQRQKLDQKHDLGLYQDHHVEVIDLSTAGQHTIDLAPLENNPWEEDRPMAIVIGDLTVSYRFQDLPFLESSYADDQGALHIYIDGANLDDTNLDEYVGILEKDERYGSASEPVEFWFDESSENGATVQIIVN